MRSPVQSLIHSPLIRPFMRSFHYPFVRSSITSPIRIVHSPMLALIPSFVRPFVSCMRSVSGTLIHSFINSFARLFARSFIRPFVRAWVGVDSGLGPVNVWCSFWGVQRMSGKIPPNAGAATSEHA